MTDRQSQTHRSHRPTTALVCSIRPLSLVIAAMRPKMGAHDQYLLVV